LLAKPVDVDIARMVGIDHAISDFILFVTPTGAEIASIGQLVARMREGYDVVTVVDSDLPSSQSERPVYHRLYVIYFKFYSLLTRQNIKPEGVAFRLLSRAAALFIVGQFGGEIFLKARDIGGAFPASQISIPGIARGQPRPHTYGQAWKKAFRMLSSTVAPLRIALMASFTAAALSVVYSAYITVVFLFLPYVRGWTTLSFQISGMMMLFSFIFILLLEYVIQIHAGSPTLARRGLVVREWRSPRTKRPSRLNIVDPGGLYYLGAPREPDAANSEGVEGSGLR
jgi:polyisoprenyl-phosphate glycosyltransferase